MRFFPDLLALPISRDSYGKPTLAYAQGWFAENMAGMNNLGRI